MHPLGARLVDNPVAEEGLVQIGCRGWCVDQPPAVVAVPLLRWRGQAAEYRCRGDDLPGAEAVRVLDHGGYLHGLLAGTVVAHVDVGTDTDVITNVDVQCVGERGGERSLTSTGRRLAGADAVDALGHRIREIQHDPL